MNAKENKFSEDENKSKSKRRSVKQQIAFYETLKSEGPISQKDEDDDYKTFDESRTVDEKREETKRSSDEGDVSQRQAVQLTASDGFDLKKGSQHTISLQDDIDTGKQPSVSRLIGAFEEASISKTSYATDDKANGKRRAETKEQKFQEEIFRTSKQNTEQFCIV